MFNQILPRPVDNIYRGHKLALWAFALLVLIKCAIGVNSILNGHFVASSADGMPLDAFGEAGAQAVVSLFAIWGLSQLIICLLCLLVLGRYRSLVPLMFSLLLLEHLGRKLILHFLPIAKTGTPPGSVVNLVLLGLMVCGLALSVWNSSDRKNQ